jgi:CheY-like chemotaxis protein
MSNISENIKDQDEMESKTQTIPLSVRIPPKAGEDGTSIKTKSEEFYKEPGDIFSSGILTATSGTNSEESEKKCSPISELKFRILVVDDDENIREMLEDFLNLEGHETVLAKDGEEALKIFSQQDFDVVITDLGMPGMSGWEVNKCVKEIKPKTPVVLITGWGAQLGAEELKKNNVDWLLSKPFNLDQFKEMIERVGAKLTGNDSS